ncbi:MAG TPA: acyl carrier protein [Acidimicrobiales bacterium]|nr:acyl carrier protein [Acidimicrobiales bacterium]
MNRNDVLGTIREVAVEILGVEGDAVNEGASFKDDLGADSLDLVEVVMALEERLDIAIPEEELGDITTVGQAIDVVLAKVAART